MNHIDQKILELYVLKDESVTAQRDAIEAHLKECAGCRELYARMEDLYAGFLDSMDSERNQDTQKLHLVKSKKSSLVQATPSPLQEVRANYEIERAPIRRIVLFAKRHPVVSSTMSLFVIGFFALLGLQVFKTTEKIDENPSYYIYSPDNKLEVYNKENNLLWSLPSNGLEQYKLPEFNKENSFSQIVDVDGDGVNEIISVLPLGSEGTRNNTIKIINNKGKIINRFSFADSVFYYKENAYRNIFFPSSFVPFQTKLHELNFIVLADCGRSPNKVVRMDGNLNILGTYWNYGKLTGCRIMQDGITGKNILAVAGNNDVNDMDSGREPVLIILDPEKLVGNSESSATQGFGVKISNAELYYLRFPKTDMEIALNSRTASSIFGAHVKSEIEVNVKTEMIGFNYTFSLNNLEVLSVKFNAPTETTHNKLKFEGMIHSTFNQHYLENLKSNVEYWDGEKWNKRVTKVNHSSALSSNK